LKERNSNVEKGVLNEHLSAFLHLNGKKIFQVSGKARLIYNFPCRFQMG
jgi:hypothetical protein